MKFIKNIAILSIMISIASCATTKPIYSLQNKYITFNGTKDVLMRPENLNAIALVPFIDGVNAQNSGIIVSQLIGQALKNNGFDIQDRSIINEVLKERAAIASGLFPDVELQQIGAKVGARFIIHGLVTKYKSTTLEKPGNEYTTLKKTLFGNVLETTHQETSIRESYTTGFRIKIIDITSAKTIYDAEISIDNSGFDNVQAVEAGINQLILYDQIVSKKDSIKNSRFRSGEKAVSFDNSAIHSYLEDAQQIREAKNNKNRYHLISKAMDSSANILAQNERVIVEINERGRYQYCDPENFSHLASEAISGLFEIGDSVNVIKLLKWAKQNRINDPATSNKIITTFQRNSRSFSSFDQFALRRDYGIIFTPTDESGNCFSQRKPCIKSDPKVDSIAAPNNINIKHNSDVRYR